MEPKEHKPKFSVATRAQAMTLRHCGYSFKNIEEQTGINERQLQHIIRTAKKHGYDPEKALRLEDEYFPDGHKTGRPRKFTEEQAEALLRAAQVQEDGTKKTNAVLAKEFGVSERTVRRRREQQGYAGTPPNGNRVRKSSTPKPKPLLAYKAEAGPQPQLTPQGHPNSNIHPQLLGPIAPIAPIGNQAPILPGINQHHNAYDQNLIQRLQNENVNTNFAGIGLASYNPAPYQQQPPHPAQNNQNHQQSAPS